MVYTCVYYIKQKTNGHTRTSMFLEMALKCLYSWVCVTLNLFPAINKSRSLILRNIVLETKARVTCNNIVHNSISHIFLTAYIDEFRPVGNITRKTLEFLLRKFQTIAIKLDTFKLINTICIFIKGFKYNLIG